jgi:hypothetical protein
MIFLIGIERRIFGCFNHEMERIKKMEGASTFIVTALS